MGIYDREYYRREGPSYLGAWADSGKVCKWLVAINVVMFILQLVTFPQTKAEDLLDPEAMQTAGVITDWLAMKPDAVFYQGQVWRLLTGCFLHSPYSFWHILVNMLVLWFFGRYMEDLYGHREFLAFYLVSGIVGNLAWGLTALWSHQQGDPYVYALGASGAVTAVMVLCALIYPYKTILLWWILPVPFWVFALVYVAGDLFVFLRGADTGVAVAAHLGGAAFALGYQKLGWRLTSGRWGDFFRKMQRPLRPQLRIYRDDEAASVRTSVPEPRIDEQLEAKADAVLEKINRFGKESLTAEERDILQRASEQYRKKRT